MLGIGRKWAGSQILMKSCNMAVDPFLAIDC